MLFRSALLAAFNSQGGGQLYLDATKGHLIIPSFGTKPTNAPVPATIGTGGNGATVTITGTDMSGQIQIKTASKEITTEAGKTAANVTLANAFPKGGKMSLTPSDGPSAAILPFAAVYSTTQWKIGFGGIPAVSTTYTYQYLVVGE